MSAVVSYSGAIGCMAVDPDPDDGESYGGVGCMYVLYIVSIAFDVYVGVRELGDSNGIDGIGAIILAAAIIFRALMCMSSVG